MTTLYITEFRLLSKDGASDVVPAAMQPALANQTRSLSTSSAQSTAFNTQTAMVRLQTDVDCFVLFGTDPTATTSSMPLAANTPEYFGVPKGMSFKVAAITA
jgi:hypothetical protein